MRKLLFVIALIVAFSGCVSEPKVESTKPWEGHFLTIEEFKQNTSDINLDKNESIWVLSNHTLNRLLKNVRK